MRTFNKRSKIWGFVFLFFIVLALEILSINDIIPSLFLPPPSQIFAALYKLMFSASYWVDLSASFERMATGYLIAVVVAVLIGTLMGSSRFIYNLLEPFIEIIRPIPSVAIIPAAILFLGIGNVMKISIIAYASIWPILINTIDGIRNVDPLQIDTGKVFGLKNWQIIKDIRLPNAAPYILSGMRISLAITLILTVTVEMVSGSNGIGLFVLNSQRSFNIPEMYAGIITVAVTGYLLNKIFLLIELKFMRWNKKLTRQK